jgi:hypothetical protein
MCAGCGARKGKLSRRDARPVLPVRQATGRPLRRPRQSQPRPRAGDGKPTPLHQSVKRAGGSDYAPPGQIVQGRAEAVAQSRWNIWIYKPADRDLSRRVRKTALGPPALGTICPFCGPGPSKFTWPDHCGEPSCMATHQGQGDSRSPKPEWTNCPDAGGTICPQTDGPVLVPGLVPGQHRGVCTRSRARRSRIPPSPLASQRCVQ